MNEAVDVKLSNQQIEKAKARITYQRTMIHRLGFGANPHLARVANETLTSMEDRLAALLVDHAKLLAEHGE